MEKGGGLAWLVLLTGALVEAVPRQPNIGCLFSHGLCRAKTEWCYDDGAFGRCLQSYSGTSPEELYRHELDKEELDVLEREMEKLLSQGYRWSHRYTQCVLQALLYAFQAETDFDRGICEKWKDDNLDSALRAIEGNNELEMDGRDMAYIRYTPSVNNPHADFADEVYFPPENHQEVETVDEVLPNYAVVRRSLPRKNHFITKYNNAENSRSRAVPKDEPIFLPGTADVEGISDKVYPVEDPKGFFIDYNTPEGFRRGLETKDFLPPGNDISRNEIPLAVSLPREPTMHEMAEMFENGYNIPSYFGDVNGREYVKIPEHNEEDTRRLLLQAFGERLLGGGDVPRREEEADKGYTEGGLVLIQDKPKGDSYTNFLNKLGWGFERRERLDVKKPGPQFNTNSFAFQGTSSSPEPPPPNPKITPKKDVGQKESMNDGNLKPVPKMEILPQKKEIEEPTETNTEQYDLVDTTYAYIEFKDSIRTWKEGSHIINVVAELLHIPRGIFTHERVDRNEVTFKVVEPNDLGLNASEVARRIVQIKDKLRLEVGVVLTSAGIGDKTKLPAAVRLTGENDSEVYVVLVIVCGVLGCLTLSAAVLLLTRRHSHNKLHNMTASDTEPSKHYQDLCRARMSSKSQSDVTTGAGVPAPAQRITSLSKESDNSPSSRSSTSSWSEEPALSNMDISTGHMVLTYMEDHLRNKDRLETEWAALCCYEAEPCATTIAQRPENQQKNRYPNALPYDHARVVLNELSNITGSDYINASTITDHDPRNPAYIVCQGPLPHTAPDLWQMVWEQGCVVIVMLTRLVENDTAMCHRYWPEEGSELYHIYEVHLVSEHIWCDDYLVRSFYLKNLKTGETRTVTQFHFLSWPDNGVPTSTKALLEFRRKVNKSFRGRSCPIVVHCNDGVGRSGTYCLLDMVLNRMGKGAKEIDIAATLEHIRDQRQSSVATRQQFQLVLSAVAEEVQAILRILPPAQPTNGQE